MNIKKLALILSIGMGATGSSAYATIDTLEREVQHSQTHAAEFAWLHWNETEMNATASLRIDSPVQDTISEASTLALLGIGLIGLRLSRRNIKKEN